MTGPQILSAFCGRSGAMRTVCNIGAGDLTGKQIGDSPNGGIVINNPDDMFDSIFSGKIIPGMMACLPVFDGFVDSLVGPVGQENISCLCPSCFNMIYP